MSRKVEEQEVRRMSTDPDADEGFYDKPSISPVNSMEGGSRTMAILEGVVV